VPHDVHFLSPIQYCTTAVLLFLSTILQLEELRTFLPVVSQLLYSNIFWLLVACCCRWL